MSINSVFLPSRSGDTLSRFCDLSKEADMKELYTVLIELDDDELSYEN
jgi:hypothetical protein